jgi:C4-type Zn-finger protein
MLMAAFLTSNQVGRVRDPHTSRKVVVTMQKCPQCGFRKTDVWIIRDPDTGRVVKSLTVCMNCQAVIKTTKSKRWWRKS